MGIKRIYRRGMLGIVDEAGGRSRLVGIHRMSFDTRLSSFFPPSCSACESSSIEML